MHEALNNLFSRIFHLFGYELKRVKKKSDESVVSGRDPFHDQKILMSRSASDIVIFDIGAHHGQTTEKYLYYFPRATIHCFEPSKSSQGVLNKKYKNQPKVHICPEAVSNKNSNVTLYINEFDATNSLFPRASKEKRYYPSFASTCGEDQVQAISIDSYIASNKVQNIDILKLDIQGGELRALKGAENLLRNSPPQIIYTECMFVPHYESAPLFHEIWEFLIQFGYSLYSIYDIHYARDGQIRYGDAMFVNVDIRKDVIEHMCDEA